MKRDMCSHGAKNETLLFLLVSPPAAGSVVSPPEAGAGPSVVVVVVVVVVDLVVVLFAESNTINATHYSHMPYEYYSVEIAYFAKHIISKFIIMKRDMG